MRINQKGFSIVEVLIASAMLGGIALVVGQLSKNSSEVVRRATNSTEINEAINRIQKYMLDGDSCMLTLSGAGNLAEGEENKILYQIRRANKVLKQDDFPSGVGIGDAIITIPPTQPGLPPRYVLEEFVAFEVGEKLGVSSKINIDSIKLSRGSGDDGKYVKMRVEFDRDPDPNKKKTIAKTIELNALYDSSNTLQKCYSQMDNAVTTAVQSACNALQGTINSSGECMDGRICDFETQMVQLHGGETISCTTKVENKMLYNNDHAESHCTDIGGSVKNSSGILLCQKSGTTCPPGWQRLGNWSRTTANTGSGKRCVNGIGCGSRCRNSCTTGSHIWANAGQETCQARDRRSVGRCSKTSRTTITATLTHVGCY